MKKQINQKWIISVALLAVAFFALALTTFAQDEAQKVFKVGDRVEVDPQGYAMTYKYKKWHKATVIKIRPSGGGVDSYDVKIDAEDDSGSQVVHVVTNADMDMIRPLKEVEKNDAKKADADQTEKVEPEKEKPAPNDQACQPSDVISGNSQTNIFKRLIQLSYEHQPEAEQDYTATVSFQSFKIGATHPWRPGVGGESPDGHGGKAGTTIYPVKAVYTVCKDHPGYIPTDYRGDIEKRQDDLTFTCFKNEFGEWQCNPQGMIGKVVWIKK